MAAIGDTVFIEKTDEGIQVKNLTAKVPSKYGSITYKLDDEEDEKEDDSGKENVPNNGRNAISTREDTIMAGRTRGERAKFDQVDRKEAEVALKKN